MTQQTAEQPQASQPAWPRRGQNGGACELFSTPAVIDGRYQVIGPIGRGGMGSVLEVSRITDSMRFALKYCETTVLGKRRLAREAKILGSIRHPHVLTVIDANLAHNPPYYVMSLAVETLESELVVRGSDVGWSLAVFRQICLGVDALHQVGVIHRDLKPANVLRLGDDRHVVADLGTAKREPRDSTILTRTCAILGTLCYLAPEQMMPGGSRHADARTDVFQLGKVFYQMLTRRSPAVMDPAALPSGLAHIVARATATRPSDRYPDVASLLKAVESYETSRSSVDDRQAALDQIALRIERLAASRSPGKDCQIALLDALAGLDRLGDDDFLNGFDRVPLEVLVLLARHDASRMPPLLASYTQRLERAAMRRHFQYADVVARRMQAVFQGARQPSVKAQALGALLIAAVVLNRYAAMAAFKNLLFQIQEAETALLVAELLRERRDYFQEVVPGLNLERLHPVLQGVIQELAWTETVSF